MGSGSTNFGLSPDFDKLKLVGSKEPAKDHESVINCWSNISIRGDLGVLAVIRSDNKNFSVRCRSGASPFDIPVEGHK
jgi:hypothetical protein